MKRQGLWIACVVVLIGIGILVGGSGYAQDADGTGKARCSLATLRGTYLFAFDGVVIDGDDQVPFAGAGYEVYDGKGKFEGVASESVNGDINRNVHYSGRYTVKADCPGTFTTEHGFHADQFMAPDGSMFTFILTDPGVVASGFELRGTAKRVGD